METNTAVETNDLYNGREAEVIGHFNEGFSYSKSKLEASLHKLTSDRKSVKPTKSSIAVKNQDTERIMTEFDISQALAEKVLSENGNDLDKALRALVAS